MVVTGQIGRSRNMHPVLVCSQYWSLFQKGILEFGISVWTCKVLCLVHGKD